MLPQKSVGLFFFLCTVAVVLSRHRHIRHCETPHGYRGSCILAKNCFPIIDFIKARSQIGLTVNERQYIKATQCSNDNNAAPFACCALGDPFFSAPVPQPITQRPIGIGNILPNPDNWECGVDKVANRIFGGDEAEIGEFPWMALLYYQANDSKPEFGCGGSLINHRYVLTVSHCLVGNVILFKGNLVHVRLGEHNRDTDVDCEITGSLRNCASPVLDVAVESIIVHPDYSNDDVNRRNDIGLVRLAREVAYSEFVQPICLLPPAFESNVGALLTGVGWGTTITNRASNTKQKITLPVVNLADCQAKFQQLKKPITVTNAQMCAGGDLQRDTCAGDSGGPLMALLNSQWYAEGLVSFGVRCGLRGWPSVYTKVTSYLSWIKSNVSP